MTTGTHFQFSVANMPAQREFMESTAPELLGTGSFGAGKSRLLCEKGLFLSLKYPGNFGAIFRKTMASLRVTTMQTWFRDTCPPEYIASMNNQTEICTLVNGSKIVFLGLDDFQKIGSLELGWAGIDEAIEIEEDDYMMILGRLRLSSVPFRQVFLATNPGSPSHFLYQRFYVQGEGRKVEFNSLQNPYTPADYKERLKRFTGHYKERFVEGKWVGFEGLVYDNLNPQRHVIERFDIPKSWKVYRAIDFGFSNPFVCSWWAVHPAVEVSAKCPKHGEGPGFSNTCTCCSCPAPSHRAQTYYRFREIYMSQRTVTAHGMKIRRLSLEPVELTVADWDSGDRAELEQQGIPTIKAKKDISQGIQSVYSAISGDRVYFLKNSLVEVDYSLQEGTPRRPCCTEEEFPTYSWQPVRGLLNQKEAPRDANNHGLDGLRYLIHTLEGNEVLGEVGFGKKRSGVGDNEPGSLVTVGSSRNWGSFRGSGNGWGKSRNWR